MFFALDDDVIAKNVARLGRKFRLSFVRVFGSAASTSASPRDVDLLVGMRLLAPDEREALGDALTRVFGKAVDIVQLRPGLNPTLVEEVGLESRPLWESARGRSDYAVLIDRLLAIAQDERLSYPQSLRAEAVKRLARRLRVP